MVVVGNGGLTPAVTAAAGFGGGDGAAIVLGDGAVTPVASAVVGFGGAITGASGGCVALVPITGALACGARSRNHHAPPPATTNNNATAASAMIGTGKCLTGAATDVVGAGATASLRGSDGAGRGGETIVVSA